ncbi:MAG: hypothetical protein O7D86_10410 [Proteobacteria bacterium]|nr:hypothetical protein [Pseudomonadota bacterium]
MTNIIWKTSNLKQEYFYLVIASIISASIYAVLIVPLFKDVFEGVLFGIFIVGWVAFSTYRTRPRVINLEGIELSFNNLGTYSLENLQDAKMKRILGVERVLEIKTGEATGTMSLHGVPNEIRVKLIEALRERISR